MVRGLFGGNFQKVGISFIIKQEFTPSNSPEYSGVAGRGLSIIDAAAMSARVQSGVKLPHVQLPPTEPLWAEATHWACDALNRTATTANRESESPYETWHGSPAPASAYAF